VRLTGLAPAKINLFLHVGPVQADGYHPLASLVAFADVGDRITVERADALSLSVEGPFGAGLAAEPDNLILKALRALGQAAGIGEPPLRVVLDKQLPIAAGLGGGSSDAGTALKLARTLLNLDLDDVALEAVAGVVGADGPMCLRARSAWAEGRGDLLTDTPDLPPLHAVLVNPGVPSSTGPVYRAFDAGPAGSTERPVAPRDWSPATVIDWLGEQRNDLETPALALTPAIREPLTAMARQTGVGLTRMSGSGATVFGLFAAASDADRAVETLGRDHGDWWVRRAVLGASAPTVSL
jgi:4-diphosphocytidyl-2-C-methyl-D-erythritol kinase